MREHDGEKKNYLCETLGAINKHRKKRSQYTIDIFRRTEIALDNWKEGIDNQRGRITKVSSD